MRPENADFYNLHFSTFQFGFFRLTDKQIDDAVEKYSNTDSAKERDRQVFTRAEHDQKVEFIFDFFLCQFQNFETHLNLRLFNFHF